MARSNVATRPLCLSVMFSGPHFRGATAPSSSRRVTQSGGMKRSRPPALSGKSWVFVAAGLTALICLPNNWFIKSESTHDNDTLYSTF